MRTTLEATFDDPAGLQQALHELADHGIAPAEVTYPLAPQPGRLVLQTDPERAMRVVEMLSSHNAREVVRRPAEAQVARADESRRRGTEEQVGARPPEFADDGAMVDDEWSIYADRERSRATTARLYNPA